MKVKKIAIAALDRIEKKPWIVCIVFLFFVFFLYRSLFRSYFEADEWVLFTYYLPLTTKPLGFFTALISTVLDNGALSGGQHVIPIASEIFFLNTKFFGLHYVPYAFMTLLLHAINSFLIFLFVRYSLPDKAKYTRTIFSLLSGLFFIMCPISLHAITGAAPFYGQNVLSVTFFLLCILFYKLAFKKNNKRFIYFSIFFLFLSLFTKETAFFLFALLPIMTAMEKNVFSLKHLSKLYIVCLIVYLSFRFLLPNLSHLPEKVSDMLLARYLPSSYTQPVKPKDTGTIVSRDISIYKNLPGEILFRSITFPIKMTGTLFVPRETLQAIVLFISPIVYPLPPSDVKAEQSEASVGFTYGPGNGFMLYVISVGILILICYVIRKSVQKKQIGEAKTLATGLTIIILSALPLVAIIFSFPRWGFDTYFDSRFYYNPGVGAAIVFPFLLFAISDFIAKTLRIRSLAIIASLLFILYTANDVYVIDKNLTGTVDNTGYVRKEIFRQIKHYLPVLPKKVVFFAETDSLSPYGPVLPFQTSIPQAFSVAYYDTSPLPDSFFDKPILGGKQEGYMYADGRGFGYYATKKQLAKDLANGKFAVSDIYAFYYHFQNTKITNETAQIRKEMTLYLKEHQSDMGWKKFLDPATNISFLYPPQTDIEDHTDIASPSVVKAFSIDNQSFHATISIANVTTLTLNDIQLIRNLQTSGIANMKKVSYDKFNNNNALVVIGGGERQYFLQFDNVLIQLDAKDFDQDRVLLIEKFLGSVEVAKQ